MAGLDLRVLQAANASRQDEWPGAQAVTPSYRGNELAGEVGEACNVIKKLERIRLGIAGSTDTVEHLAEELGDIIICAALIANDFGIDLSASTRDKFNATSAKIGLLSRV